VTGWLFMTAVRTCFVCAPDGGKTRTSETIGSTKKKPRLGVSEPVEGSVNTRRARVAAVANAGRCDNPVKWFADLQGTAMNLSVSTMQVLVWANYLCLFLVWTYIARSYPSLPAARTWQIGTFFASLGALLGAMRGIIPDFIPIIIGNTLLALGSCYVWIGIRQFYGRPQPIRSCMAVVGSLVVVLIASVIYIDSIAMRIATLSLAQIYVLAQILRDLRTNSGDRRSPGANLLGLLCIVVITLQVVRAGAAISGLGGPMSIVAFNGIQAVILLILIIVGTMSHFGLLLMAIDRLRAEVADLALVDDLTGIANRRHLLTHLSEACRQSVRSGRPLALMVIDIDRFKLINDGYGHGAGDECLRAFAQAALGTLRQTDLLARSGGDEFCVVLPATSLTETALIARNLIQAARATHVEWKGDVITMTISIGLATWSPEIGDEAERLVHQADQALYIAKKQGRDRLAVYEMPALVVKRVA